MLTPVDRRSERRTAQALTALRQAPIDTRWCRSLCEASDGRASGSIARRGALDIQAIELTSQPTGRRDGHGNYYRYRGVVHLASGATVPIWDVFLAVRPGSGAEAAAWSSSSSGGSDGWRAGAAGLGAGLVAFGLVTLVRRRRDRDAVPGRPARVPALGRIGAGGLTTLALVLLSPSATFGQTWQVVEYYDVDALGSVRVVTDAQGQVVARHDFLPFGEELNPQTLPHDKRLFTGQERDVETGQDYFGAQQLRTDLGRFLAPDPMTLVPRVVGAQA